MFTLRLTSMFVSGCKQMRPEIFLPARQPRPLPSERSFRSSGERFEFGYHSAILRKLDILSVEWLPISRKSRCIGNQHSSVGFMRHSISPEVASNPLDLIWQLMDNYTLIPCRPCYGYPPNYRYCGQTKRCYAGSNGYHEKCLEFNSKILLIVENFEGGTLV